MTLDKHFKKKIRARMEKTGESYSTARAMLVRLGDVGSLSERATAAEAAPLTVRSSTPDSDLIPFEAVDLDVESEYVPVAETRPDGSGTADDEAREDEMPWEYDAREAVELALQEARFEVDEDDESIVFLPSLDFGGKHSRDLEFRSVKELVAELRERAHDAWYGSVPFDGGPVFDFPGDDLIYRMLSKYRAELTKLGWEL
jgi:hypothetical protein